MLRDKRAIETPRTAVVHTVTHGVGASGGGLSTSAAGTVLKQGRHACAIPLSAATRSPPGNTVALPSAEPRAPPPPSSPNPPPVRPSRQPRQLRVSLQRGRCCPAVTVRSTFSFSVTITAISNNTEKLSTNDNINAEAKPRLNL